MARRFGAARARRRDVGATGRSIGAVRRGDTSVIGGRWSVISVEDWRLNDMAGAVPRSRLAVLGALGLVAACGGKQPERSPTIPVSVSPAVRIDAPAMLTANGVVEPLQTVAVEAQVGGILTEVSFQEGDDVSE